MSGILAQTVVPPVDRQLTVADLALFPTRIASGDVDYQLDRGRLLIMAPPGGLHGSLQALFCAELVNQGQRKGFGHAYSEVGIVLMRNPDSVYGADLAFVGKRKSPVKFSPEGYLETIPELVVEIRSKNDTIPELKHKAAEYLAVGVQIVLVVDPDSKTVIEHRPNVEPRVFGESETLLLDELIPGFRLNVSEYFDEVMR